MAVRFYDPTGARHGIPTYPWSLAPDGLATRRQLRDQGLRPGGQEIAAQVMWFNPGGAGCGSRTSTPSRGRSRFAR
ncbi:hypothetical protein SMD11_3094 [Streptomyces albireticuli]|uniref:Uncharacterized protein n=1 Tax=Streptomyces albireticuli TaxID=1940 RepID=A0A1Z2L398_9ACTN|nr:hypothetical protein SMD11_3094 [Streptomyces albireticuli]